jgi:hypothetical protein
MAVQGALYVQYGCGLCAPTGWENFDVSPTLRLQKIPLLGRLLTRAGPTFPKNVRYGDIVRGLPISAGSCAVIYCSHVLEHLSLADFRTALRRTLEYLRPGGVFRFVLPDLEKLAGDYVSSSDVRASITFMQETYLGHLTRQRGVGGALRAWLGNSEHLWMWDFKAMSAELVESGFGDIRRAQFGDSADPRFREVEDPGRWHGQLGVECRRPAEP